MRTADLLGRKLGRRRVQRVRRAGARLLVYGGISTLVQWGELQVVDLEREQLLLRRSFTFRGMRRFATRRASYAKT
jgi:hypothetical protein